MSYTEAQSRWLQGDLCGAMDQLLSTLEHRIRSKQLNDIRFADDDLNGIKLLADLAALSGEFQAAEVLLHTITTLYEQENSFYWADYTRIRRMQFCIDQGKLHSANLLLQDMAPRIGRIEQIQFSEHGLIQWEEIILWPNNDHQEQRVVLAELLLALGRLLLALGQYNAAFNVLQRGLFHAQSESNLQSSSLARQTILPLKLAIASVHLERGELAEADNSLRELQTEFGDNLNQELKPHVFGISSKLSLLRGNFGAALQTLNQARDAYHQLGARRAALQANLNLAQVLILLNQTSLAKQYLSDTITQAEQLEDQTLLERAELLIQIASARGQSLIVKSPFQMPPFSASTSKNYPISTSTQQPNLLITTQSANYLAWFENRALEFRWQLSQLNFKAAIYLLKHIKSTFGSSESVLINTQIRILEATLAYCQGAEEEATSPSINSVAIGIRRANVILEEVCPVLRELELKPELWQVQRMLGWCRTRLNTPQSEQETLVEENNTLLDQLTESLSPEDRAIYLLNKWTADEEFLATTINHLQQFQIQLDRGSLWFRPWRKWQLMNRLNHLIEKIDQHKNTRVEHALEGEVYGRVKVSRPLPFWKRLVTHPRHRLTLSFLVLPDRVLIIRSGWLLLNFCVVPVTRLMLRNVVQRWYGNINGFSGSRDLSSTPEVSNYDTKMINLERENEELTSSLSNLLEIPKLLKVSRRITSLTIVPDDILHGFPFAAIPYRNRYLVEHYAISIAYETNFEKLKREKVSRKTRALSVGVGIGLEAKKIPPLSGVSRELEQVHDWFEHYGITTVSLRDNEAYKSDVIQNLHHTNLLHIACHGIFDSDNPFNSGLVLIPDGKAIDILSLKDLSSLFLNELLHVTLSSCWTADHFVLPGRWVISLPETLWRSGVSSILSCRWEVYDKVAIYFMRRFYENLASHPRDEALRQTQLEFIRQPSLIPEKTKERLNLANPLFWSGFSLYGNFYTLSLPKKINRTS